MFVSCSHFLTLLLLLLQVLGVPCEPVHQGMDCNEDRPATLWLTKDYSTFDLPFRSKPNLIKIGNLNLMIELQTIQAGMSSAQPQAEAVSLKFWLVYV